MKQLIFLVDLDETLVHSLSRWDSTPGDYTQWAFLSFPDDRIVIKTQKDYHKLKHVKSVKQKEWPHFVTDFFAEYPNEPVDVTKRRTKVNPFAFEMLTYLRSFGVPVKMFTASGWDYANAHNEMFGFGFDKKDIISANHYIEGFSWDDKSKHFILIDNLQMHLNDKIRGAGTDNLSYLTFPPFMGHSDYHERPVMERVKGFVEDVQEILARKA